VKEKCESKYEADDSSDELLDSSSSESDASAATDSLAAITVTLRTLHPDTKYMAPDPSVGKKAEFFLMGVADARTMVRSMSPPGVGGYDSRRKLMADAALNAVQLPGRCHTGQDKQS
jgi:hypothetical protein